MAPPACWHMAPCAALGAQTAPALCSGHTVRPRARTLVNNAVQWRHMHPTRASLQPPTLARAAPLSVIVHADCVYIFPSKRLFCGSRRSVLLLLPCLRPSTARPTTLRVLRPRLLRRAMSSSWQALCGPTWRCGPALHHNLLAAPSTQASGAPQGVTSHPSVRLE